MLTSRTPLAPYAPNLGSLLRDNSTSRPEAPFLCERAGDGGWRTVTFGQAWDAARSIGQALIQRGLGAERPAMALSGNSVDEALLMLGCFVAGIPFVPVSPAYSLMSKDFEKVRHAVELTKPGLVFAAPAEPFAGAVESIGAHTEAIASIVDLLAVRPTKAVDDAFAAVGAGTVAKILFTSGSTGLPKGVINTHGMLAANQQQLAQVWPFTAAEPPVLVDWLPWSHTFGGSHNFNLVLRAGGTIYIDGGRPAPGQIDTTVANLREISPTVYFNVPAGYGALLPFLEDDSNLAAYFFSRLRLIFYAAAALPQALWDRLDAVAHKTVGHAVPMTSAWGSTETSPLATSAHFALDGPGVIGVPVPGVTIKLVPSGTKLEIRVKGPNVTPGYVGRPDLTAEAFDEAGFYRIGDAAKFLDPSRPERGLVFDGRVAEDFKLTTGTWVSVGILRTAVLSACAPLLQDAVITGHDRDEVGVLGWISAPAAERALGADARPEAIAERIRAGIEKHNSENPASSTRIGRLLILTEPPSIDGNEITDKGYINQRAVVERRAELVEAMYQGEPEALLTFPPRHS
jgi:feruloyl-CoA synthase